MVWSKEKASRCDSGQYRTISGTVHLTEVRLGILVNAWQSGVKPSSVKVPRPYSSVPQRAFVSRLHSTSTSAATKKQAGAIAGTIILSQAAHLSEAMLVLGSTSASLMTTDISLPAVILLSARLLAEAV